MNKIIRSFDPVASSNATVVVLGSMPGEQSLAATQYYAHPRNAFWMIMQQIVGIDAGAAYQERLASLRERGIALWDVLHSCHRQGSLDSAIRRGSGEVNDFNTFFSNHPAIETVLFNGATSKRYYERYVLPDLIRIPRNHLQMPSTSPAHAAMPLAQKVAAWRTGLNFARDA